jgi:hypothetical protein
MRAISRPIDVDVPYAEEKIASGRGLVPHRTPRVKATNQLKGKSLGCARSNEMRGRSVASFPAATRSTLDA